MKTTAPRFASSTAVLLVVVLLAGSFPVSTENAQAHVDLTHHLDVDRSPATYYGLADYVAIRVFDPALDSDDNSRTITVDATVTGGPTTALTLYETLEPDGDDAVGVFVGAFGFSTTSGAGNIQVPSTGDSVTINLVHDPGAPGAAGGAPTDAVPITWKRTFDAQMTLGKGGLFNRYVGNGATIQVNVTDLDHKGADRVFVAIRPHGSAGFETMELAERGDTGRFFGNFTIRPTDDTSLTVNDVHVGTGDNTRTVYGIGSPVATLQLRAMNLLRPHLAANPTLLTPGAAGDYTFDPHGRITLTSAGRSALGTRDLVANYTMPTAVEVVEVRVDDPATSTNEADPNFAPDLVDRTHREAFTVYYQDVRDKDGEPVLRSVAGEWLESPGATFHMLDDDLATGLPSGTDGIPHLFGSQSKLGLRVLDEDANANRGAVDKITVRVASYTTVNPASEGFTLLEEETLELAESGPNTAEFTALLPLETVRVANNDVLQISTIAGLRTVIKGSYAEARGANGGAQGVSAMAFGTGFTKPDRVAFASTGTGVVQLIRVATSAPASEFFGLGAGLVKVRVVDPDITLCGLLGSDRVRLRSGASPEAEAVPFVDGDRVGSGCEKTFGFKPPAGPGTCGAALCLRVADGAAIAAEYTDPTNAVGQLNQIITANAVWRQGFDASVAFGGRYFATTESVPLVVQDPDLTANEVQVTVTSLQDPGGVTYRLARDTASPIPGTYRGTALFETLALSVANNNKVAVSNEGTVLASYLDPRRANGLTNVLVTDSAIILHPGSGAAEINAENVYLDVPLSVTLRDGNAGANLQAVVANISTTNPLLDGVAGTTANDVRDVGETFQVGFGPATTTASVPFDFEGRRLAHTQKGNGNSDQVVLLERFPVKPGTASVFVAGQPATVVAGFGIVPVSPTDTTPDDPCDSPQRCVNTNSYAFNPTFGRVRFGQSDDPGAIPAAGADIVVIYEPFEYYNETHVLQFQPFGPGAGLRLKNAAALVGASDVLPDGTPNGGVFVDCRDDPETPGDAGTAGDERFVCHNGNVKTLRGQKIFRVFVNGREFKWCTSDDYEDSDGDCENQGADQPMDGADLTKPFKPPNGKYTIPSASSPVISLGLDAQVGDTVNIVYRGYDRVAGAGERLTTVGMVPLPLAMEVCQASKMTGGGETLLRRWVSPKEYEEEPTDSAVAFRARGAASDPVSFGDVVKVRPRLGFVAQGDDGNAAHPVSGQNYYKDEDDNLTGGLVQFRLDTHKVCNSKIKDVAGAGDGSDRILVQRMRDDGTTLSPLPGNPGAPSGAGLMGCIWHNDTRLYTEGLVTIDPNKASCDKVSSAAFDANTPFRVKYWIPNIDPDVVPSGACTPSLLGAPPALGDGHEVCRGIDEIAGMPFLVRKPTVPGSLAVNFCPSGGTCSAIDITDDETPAHMKVNVRTGQLTLVANYLTASRIGDQFRYTGQLITDWNREVAVGAGDTLKVTYFDASNHANALRQVSYTVPGAGGRLASSAQGRVMFNDTAGNAQEEFFGLSDYANLTVIDPDRNRDPNVVETLTVGLDARAVSRLGEEAVPAFTGTVTLFEEGTNGNTFRARLKFGTLATPAPQGLTTLRLDLTKGNQFIVKATYADLDQPALGATFKKEIEEAIQFRPATRATLKLEPGEQSGVGNPMVVTVTEADRNGRILQERLGKSTGAKNQVFTITHKPIKPDSQIVYVETAAGSGVFEAWEEVPVVQGTMGTRKVYGEFKDLTGSFQFGECQLNSAGACRNPVNGGRVPPTGTEIRIDYFQTDVIRNDAFVRLESYYVDPVSGFDLSRDARPFASECNSDGPDTGAVIENPRCYDRVDLPLQELSTNPAVFQGNVPFSETPDPTCAPAGVVPCVNAINLPELLELPSPSDGVDRAVIVATYFDYSYLERYRQRTGFNNPPVVCAGDGDGKPGAPFQQLMPGQEFPNAIPDFAGTADGDCQSDFGSKEVVQAVSGFSEATTGTLSISSRNVLWQDESGAIVVDAAKASKIVHGAGKLDIRVEDADVNANRAGADTASITLKTDSNLAGVPFSLAERDGDDLRFVGKASFGPGGNIGATARDKYVVQYNDARNAQGVQTTVQLPATLPEQQDYKWFPSGNGALTVNREVFIDTASGGPLEQPTVRVTDADRNVNANVAEQLRVRLTRVNLLNDDVTALGDANAGAMALYSLLGECTATLPAARTPLLTESGPSTGVFEGAAPLVGAGALNPDDGDTILVTYCDPHDAQGREGPLAACPTGVTLPLCRVGTAATGTAKWFDRTHGQVFFDKARYVERADVMVLTVIDEHDEGFTGGQDKVPIVLRAGPVSLQVDLLETGALTGEFQARVGLQGTDTDGIPDINVPDNVVMRAVYADVTTAAGNDATGRPGASVAEAIFAKDTLPPETEIEIESEIDPVTFGGEQWYRSPPSITLTAEDDLSEVLRIEYRWDTSSTYSTYTGAFSPPSQGRHMLRFRALDVVNNVEPDQNVTVNWDETAPGVAVTELNATRAPGGIRLAWVSPVDLNDPLEFGGFLLYRDETDEEVLTVINTTAIVTAPDEQEHTYFVRIVDAAGNEGPLSAGVEAIADITPPTMTEATILPRTTFAVGEVAKVDFSVKVLPTPDDVVANVEVTVAVPGSGTDTVVMADADGDNTYAGSYANFSRTGLYEVTFRALDAIGNAATAGFVINVTGRDTTAPTITPLAENTVVNQGEALRVQVRDNILVTRVTYRIDGGSDRQATYAADNETALVPTEGLALGAHTIVLRAFDAAGNSATAQMAFVVILPLPPGVPPPPLDVRLLTQASGDVVLRWIMVPSANLDHFEIWRSASPAKRVGTVDPDEDCPNGECSFTDRTAKSGTTYTYCILAVNATDEPVDSEGYPSKACSQVKTAGAVGGEAGTFLEKFWWVFLIAAAIVVGVAVFLVQREERAKKSRSRRRLESVPVGPGERHHIKCPACGTRFTVTGTKPIVTNCPHCGKKGILR